MITYKNVINNPEIKQLYVDINKKTNYVIDHGMLHIKHVIKNVDNICTALNVDIKTKQLSLIAAALHDAGRKDNNEEHAIYGAKFAKQFLNNQLPESEIEVVCNAIEQHDLKNFNFSTKNNVAWILILADKMDNVRSRYIKKLLTLKHKQKPSYNIQNVEIKIVDNGFYYLVFNYKNQTCKETDYRLSEIVTKFANHFGYDKVFIKQL